MTSAIQEEKLYASLAGWASVFCWVVVFTPQMWKNFREKSGEGLSLRFLVIWLIGDGFNISGVVMEGLLPTMLFLAIYYTVADVILIIQVLYYRNMMRQNGLEGEFERLIQSRQHRPLGNVSSIREENRQDATCCSTPTVALFFGTFIVIIAFSICCIYFLGVAQFFGWCSAISYIGSRVPQITKNKRKESTAGLSLGMFMFGIAGNALYCLSIFLQSIEIEYIKQNLPWLVGSGGTMFLDIFIGVQFALYRRRRNHLRATGPEQEARLEDVDDVEDVENGQDG